MLKRILFVLFCSGSLCYGAESASVAVGVFANQLYEKYTQE